MQMKIGSIGETVDGIDDINQEIMLILTTPLGSIPHRPEFGSRIYEYLDKPISLIKPLVIAETYRAIKTNTDRFYPEKVSIADISGSKIRFIITGRIKDNSVTLDILADFASKDKS